MTAPGSQTSLSTQPRGLAALADIPWQVAVLCRLIVGSVFIYASVDKLAEPAAFAQVIHNYRLVSYDVLHPMANLLPVLEVIVGICLVLGIRRRGAALLAAFLSMVFIGAIASALLRGLDISCGCFHTDGGHAVGLSLLWRDALLLLACLPPLAAHDAGPTVDRLLRLDR